MKAILPLLVIMLTGLIVLLGDACIPAWRKAKAPNWIVSLAGIGYALFLTWGQLGAYVPDNASAISFFGGAVVADKFSSVCNLILLITAGLAILLAMTYLENRKLNLGEYYALVLLSTFGAMLMAQSAELITLFIALETLSVALYVLSGFARTEERSEEAALKYFLLGAFAAGFLLYGIALIYGGTGLMNGGKGTTNLIELAQLLSGDARPNVMLMSGIALILVGLGFKAALVPFHMWTPDVYEGAPTSVTAYMAAGAKIGAFAVILRVFASMVPIADYWMLAVQALAVLTMYGGNLLAVTQDNVKRMLAYSSIAHAGYLLAGVVAATTPMAGRPEQDLTRSSAFGAIAFYLLSYTLMTMGSFGVLIWLSRRGRDIQTLSDLKGLARLDQTAAYAMLVFMLSLGGIPPTMGFIGKWFLFNSIMMANQTWLALALAGASIISIYYYLKIVWMMCFQEPEEGAVSMRADAPGGVSLAVWVTLVATLALGILPTSLQPLMTAAAAVALK